MYGAHIYYSYDTQTQVDKTCLVQKLTRHGKAQIMSEMIWAALPDFPRAPSAHIIVIATPHPASTLPH